MGEYLDKRLKYVNRLSGRFAPQVATLFGLGNTAAPTTLTLEQLSGGAAAAAVKGGGIAFDPNYLRTASKADIRGAVIHELTHVAGVGDGKSSARVEALADYARLSLNRGNPEWQASDEAKAIYEKRGDMAGPGSNNTGNVNSNKNTLLNQYSKATPSGSNPQPAPLDPNSYGAYASQVMGLQQQLAAAMALSRAGISSARGEAMVARQDIRAGRIQGTADAEAAALANGVVGSSADLANRAGVVASAGAEREAVGAAKRLAIAEQRGNQVAATGQFYTGLGAAQSDLANAQAQANILRYQQDLFDTQQTDFAALRAAILKRLRSRGRARDVLPNAAEGVGAAALAAAGAVTGAGIGALTGVDRFGRPALTGGHQPAVDQYGRPAVTNPRGRQPDPYGRPALQGGH